MIKVKNHKDEELIHFICEGPLTHDDFVNVVIPTIEAKSGDSGYLKIFMDIRKMGMMEPRAMWVDFKFGMKYLKDRGKIAYISDWWWIPVFLTMSRPFVKAELKCFKSDQYEEGWDWLNSK